MISFLFMTLSRLITLTQQSLILILLSLLIPLTLFSTHSVMAAETTIAEWSDRDLSVRDPATSGTDKTSEELKRFISGTHGFFYIPSDALSGSQGVQTLFIIIAYNLKNIIIAIASIFLLIGILKLFFSDMDEEKTRKWKNNILWVSVGVVVMQLGYSVWYALYLHNTDMINQGTASNLRKAIFDPIIQILQIAASFGFIAMMLFAFYRRVTSGGGDEGAKKANQTIITAILGFLLLNIPTRIVGAIYGGTACGSTSGGYNLDSCTRGTSDLSGFVSIFGTALSWLNTFIFFISVILIIYAGWLVLISAGDEENLKKAKHTVLYIVI